MPNTETTGKPGTMTEEHFENLVGICEDYAVKTVAQKVSKICLKSAAPFTHEYGNSLVGNAWTNTANKISAVVGTDTSKIDRDSFGEIESLVYRYGPEVVIQKLSKVANRQSKAVRESGGSATVADALKALSDSLKNIFPRA